MEDILQVAFFTVICLLVGGFGAISLIGISVFASRNKG